MTPTFVLTLHVIMLFNVVMAGRSDIQSPQQSQLATLPDGYIAYPDIGVAYKVCELRARWPEARRRCISEGAHLADIDTFQKYNYLTTQSTSNLIWTGIHKADNDTKWVSSSTGLPMTNLPWASREPWGDYYCVLTDKSRYGLRNVHCDFGVPYVCELPIPENYNAQGINTTAIC